ETIRFQEGKLINLNFHFERFFYGLDILQFVLPDFFSPSFIVEKIGELLKKNKNGKYAKIRLMAFRDEGPIFGSAHTSLSYIIETESLDAPKVLIGDGLVIDVFPEARKSCDRFSNIKSNNYLPSVMAGLYAQKHQLDDAVLLNTEGRVSETAIANLFIITGTIISTPALSEGCVAGTMRRWMLEKFSLKKYAIIEKNMAVEDIMNADEVFLTNAIQQIRWVKSFRGKHFGNKNAISVYNHISENIL
ncbi:MAG: aminotransferase class IV, partial [Ginsengibacter sp.]